MQELWVCIYSLPHKLFHPMNMKPLLLHISSLHRANLGSWAVSDKGLYSIHRKYTQPTYHHFLSLWSLPGTVLNSRNLKMENVSLNDS